MTVTTFMAQQPSWSLFHMKFRLLFAALLATFTLRAAVPPPAQLFPQDTLVLASVPDWSAAKATFDAGSYGQLWNDAAMKPFREKFQTAFKEQVLGDLEKDLGVNLADYVPLVQGQVSVALVQNGWNPKDKGSEPAFVLLVDTKDKSDQLKSRLAEVRQKLTDAKKPVKIEKIRDLEFATLVLDRKEMRAKAKAAAKAKGKADDKDAEADDDDDDATGADGKAAKAAKNTEITFGQVDSVFLLSDSPKALEKFVARLTGGSVPAIGEMAEFQASSAAASFPESYAFGWINFSLLYSAIEGAADQARPQFAAMGIDPRKALGTLGLDGLNSLSFSAQQTSEGHFARVAVNASEAKRTGLLKLLSFEAKDSAPPAFVPADAVKFQRWRLNGQQVWNTLESTLQSISPQMGGFLQMSLGALGKDKDPNFDFKKTFVANLGDDFVSYERAPQGKTLPELSNPPSITLLGSGNPEQLAAGLRAAAGLLPTGGEDLKEREFNGKKIFGAKFPSAEDPHRVIEVASSGGFVALSAQPAMIEEFLRSADGGGKSLKDLPALNDSAQKVGGMGTGLFGYEDMKESVRAVWEVMRQSGGLDKALPGADPKNSKEIAKWFDVTLLPPFEQVSKYFGPTVYAGGWDARGFSLKAYSPTAK